MLNVQKEIAAARYFPCAFSLVVTNKEWLELGTSNFVCLYKELRCLIFTECKLYKLKITKIKIIQTVKVISVGPVAQSV